MSDDFVPAPQDQALPDDLAAPRRDVGGAVGLIVATLLGLLTIGMIVGGAVALS